MQSASFQTGIFGSHSTCPHGIQTFISEMILYTF